jgi:hypothetical protein
LTRSPLGLLGYARVSISGQAFALQFGALVVGLGVVALALSSFRPSARSRGSRREPA